MTYDQTTALAFFDLHVMLNKATVALRCIIDAPSCLQRAEVLAIIAEDYLAELAEAIEVMENSTMATPLSPSQKTSH